MQHENWNGFTAGAWQKEINVRDFIQTNYREYTGDSTFLTGATPRTKAMMDKVQALFAEERARGGLGIVMVRKTMDEITYRYENGSNILSIRKTLRS